MGGRVCATRQHVVLGRICRHQGFYAHGVHSHLPAVKLCKSHARMLFAMPVHSCLFYWHVAHGISHSVQTFCSGLCSWGLSC